MAQQITLAWPAAFHGTDHPAGHVADINQVQLRIEVLAALAPAENENHLRGRRTSEVAWPNGQGRIDDDNRRPSARQSKRVALGEEFGPAIRTDNIPYGDVLILGDGSVLSNARQDAFRTRMQNA